MEDIRSATAEMRRGKKEDRRRRKIEETAGQKYNGLPITRGGHIKELYLLSIYALYNLNKSLYFVLGQSININYYCL